jgi:rhodanese-related sulfurtransferase
MKHSEEFLKLVDDAKTRVREISVADTQSKLAADKNVQLIDVREDNEWLAGHATGANISGRELLNATSHSKCPTSLPN